MLCVPLLFDDRVIGVLELLDKVDAPNFTMDDMAMLARFAEQAAVAIDQAHVQNNLTRMLQVLTGDIGAQGGLQGRIADVVAGLTNEAAYRRAIDLAVLIREIVHHGEGEARTCAVLLEGFASYLRERGARESGY
jgi:GAF domain-containing protein